MTEIQSSPYIEEQRKQYSLYILTSRAIPYAADGLKHSGRRLLWTARDGKKVKSATLAGATMPLHPHGDQSLANAINTLTAPYGNNIPLFHGDGAFGTLLNPSAFGAARYTSVKVSEFTKDVIFRDIEIVPKVPNYDSTLEEPEYFLPLVPVVLINPQEGIAVGFASTILPRDLETIINDQIAVLNDKEVKSLGVPTFTPIRQKATQVTDKNGNIKWKFVGEFERINATTIKITNLPYGMIHEQFVEKLISYEEEDKILGFEDNSKDKYNIEIKFKKGTLSKMTDDNVIDYLNLKQTVGENLNVIDFTGDRVWSPTYQEIIKQFTHWRLKWYVTRYERLANLLANDIQRYKDVLRAIDKNVGSVARKVESKEELKLVLEQLKIVNVDYIADLPVYRFTENERQKTENLLIQSEQQMKKYRHLLTDEQSRRNVYIEELKEILTKHKAGRYV